MSAAEAGIAEAEADAALAGSVAASAAKAGAVEVSVPRKLATACGFSVYGLHAAATLATSAAQKRAQLLAVLRSRALVYAEADGAALLARLLLAFLHGDGYNYNQRRCVRGAAISRAGRDLGERRRESQDWRGGEPQPDGERPAGAGAVHAAAGQEARRLAPGDGPPLSPPPLLHHLSPPPPSPPPALLHPVRLADPLAAHGHLPRVRRRRPRLLPRRTPRALPGLLPRAGLRLGQRAVPTAVALGGTTKANLCAVGGGRAHAPTDAPRRRGGAHVSELDARRLAHAILRDTRQTTPALP